MKNKGYAIFVFGGGGGAGGHIRCMMGNVEVAYSPRSIYQNSNMTPSC